MSQFSSNNQSRSPMMVNKTGKQPIFAKQTFINPKDIYNNINVETHYQETIPNRKFFEQQSAFRSPSYDKENLFQNQQNYNKTIVQNNTQHNSVQKPPLNGSQIILTSPVRQNFQQQKYLPQPQQNQLKQSTGLKSNSQSQVTLKNNNNNHFMSQQQQQQQQTEKNYKSIGKILQPNKNVQEVVRNEVQTQMSLFRDEIQKQFEEVIKSSKEKNQINSEKLNEIKESVENHQISLTKMEKDVQNLQNNVNEIEQMDFNSDESKIEQIIEERLNQQFEQKIQQINQQQSQLKQQLYTLKDDLTSDITEQIEIAKKQLNMNEDQREEDIFQCVQNMQQEWENKITQTFENLGSKVNVLEQQIGDFKGELQTPQLESMQEQIFEKFNECVSNYEKQLLSVKAQIDSKLDKEDLQEVVEGYKEKANENEQIQMFSQEIQKIQEQVNNYQPNDENQQYTQEQLNQFQDQIKQFEQYVQMSLESIESRIQETKVDENNQNQKLEQSMYQKVNFLEQRIQMLNEQYEVIQNNISQYHDENYRTQNQNTQQTQIINQNFTEINSNLQGVTDRVEKNKIKPYNKDEVIVDQNLQNNLKNSLNLEDLQVEQQQQQQQSIDNNKQEQNQQSVLVSQKFDEYMKKYEQFNQEVSNYLQTRQISSEYLSQNKKQDIIEQFQSSQKKKKDENFGNNLQSPVKISMQQLSSGKKNQINMHRRTNSNSFNNSINNFINMTEEKQQQEEIEYQLDDNGYLLNDKNEHVCDDDGNWIQLTNEHIEYLKGENMLEEQEILNLSMQSLKNSKHMK